MAKAPEQVRDPIEDGLFADMPKEHLRGIWHAPSDQSEITDLFEALYARHPRAVEETP